MGSSHTLCQPWFPTTTDLKADFLNAVSRLGDEIVPVKLHECSSEHGDTKVVVSLRTPSFGGLAIRQRDFSSISTFPSLCLRVQQQAQYAEHVLQFISKSGPLRHELRQYDLANQGLINNDRHSTIKQRILDRIKICLHGPNHPSTLEAETQAASRMASRLMAQNNVAQADLLDWTIIVDGYAALGYQSVVDIRSTNRSKTRVSSKTWIHIVALVMALSLDCQI